MKIKFYKTFSAFIFLQVFYSIAHSANKFEKKIQFGNSTISQRIIVLPDSTYLLTGFSEQGSQSSILCRLSSTGDTIWTRSYGLNDYSLDAVMTSDSGFLVVGATQNSVQDQGSAVWKIDMNGNLQWTKIISPDTLSYSVFNSIVKYGNNFLLGGFVDNTSLTGTGGWAINLVMIDSIGDIIWSKMYWEAFERFSVLSMKFLSDSTFIATGVSDDCYAIKFDTSGNIIWSKKYLSDGMLTSVEETSDHDLVFTGFSDNSNCFIMKTDLSGNVLWSSEYSDLFDPIAICRGNNNDVIISATYEGLNESNGALLRIDSIGTPLLLNKYIAVDDDYAADIKPALDGGYIFLFQKDYSSSASAILAKTDSVLSSGCEIATTLPQFNALALQASSFSLQVITQTFFQNMLLVEENNGGLVSDICSTSDIGESFYTITSSKVFPTVSSGRIFVETEKESLLTVQNSLGQTVFMKIIQGASDFFLKENGMYYYRMENILESKSGKILITDNR